MEQYPYVLSDDNVSIANDDGIWNCQFCEKSSDF